MPYKYSMLKHCYCASINVDICTSTKSIKHIFKYVYMGYDCVFVIINANQTIKSKYNI